MLTNEGLMEEKGLKTEGQRAPGQQDQKFSNDSNSPEKDGKLSKLKEKLHIGK
jgi:hypothetical protein